MTWNSSLSKDELRRLTTRCNMGCTFPFGAHQWFLFPLTADTKLIRKLNNIQSS